MDNGSSERKDLLISLKAPEQCHLWGKENIAREDLDFDVVEVYEDSSHLGRALLRCKRCGQLYYYEFYEVIDWEEGDDKQYCTYIPVENDRGLIDTLNKKSSLELLGVSPKLQWDNGGPIKWSC